MYCSDDAVATVSRLLSMILWLVGALSYVPVIALMSRICKKYHLFFIICYTTLVVSCFVSASIKFTGYLLILTRGSGVPAAINNAVWVAKFSTQASAMSCVLERGYATLYATVYENSRRSSFVTICLVVCALAGALTYAETTSDIWRKINAVSYGAFLVFMTVTLIIINRKLVVRSLQNSSLSERYQLRENVKALRLLLPFVVAITANAVFLSVGIVFFDVDTLFNLSRCRSVPSYLPVFYLILLQTTFFNSGASFYVVYLNRSVIRRRRAVSSELRNVKTVGEMSNEHYFQQYKTQWS